MRTVHFGLSSTFSIIPSAPFNFDGTFHKPSHFPAPLEAWERGKYWQALRVGEKIYGLRIVNRGSRAKPRLGVSVFGRGKIGKKERDAIARELEWRFDLASDLREFDRLARRDGGLRPVFRRWRGTRDSSALGLYELLVVSILLQNATVRRTVQMMNALLERFGTRVSFDSKTLFAMWLPAAIHDVGEDELRKLRIGYRARFLKRVSDDFSRGVIDERSLRTLDENMARRELMKLYGVGPETARILLYPACHRATLLTHIAPWQQKIYSRLFYARRRVPARKIQGDLNRRYGRFATLAVNYVWEDLFWRREREPIPWLEREIRL